MLKLKKLLVKAGIGLGVGCLVLSSFARASVPSQSQVTDDTAIYQNLSDIRAERAKDLNVDGDIARLSAIEARYHEKLPLSGPMKKISHRKYIPSQK